MTTIQVSFIIVQPYFISQVQIQVFKACFLWLKIHMSPFCPYKVYPHESFQNNLFNSIQTS